MKNVHEHEMLLGDLVNAYPMVVQLTLQSLPVSLSYRLARAMRALREEVKMYEEQKDEIIKTEVTTGATVRITDLSADAQDKLFTLLRQVVTLTVPTITIDDFEAVATVLPAHLDALLTIGMLCVERKADD